jgi:RNA polymerase sigma-70 factor (ECF subfamily)
MNGCAEVARERKITWFIGCGRGGDGAKGVAGFWAAAGSAASANGRAAGFGCALEQTPPSRVLVHPHDGKIALGTPDDVASLISLVALHDRKAFRQLYKMTNAKVFGILLRMLRDRNDAEDALQEVFVKVWGRAGTYHRSTRSPISWLASIARNHAIDLLRASRPPTVEFDIHPIALLELGPNPEELTVSADEGRQVRTRLCALSDKHGRMVHDAYVMGYSYKELAENYGMPINTVRTWLRRSLIDLRVAGDAALAPKPASSRRMHKKAGPPAAVAERSV